jgi:protein O-GlcNAc transferase
MTSAELLRLGMAEEAAGRLSEAEARYRQALELDPAGGGAHHRLGLLAQHMGRHDLARSHIVRAIELEPATAEYHVDLGGVLMALGRLDDAERCYREALRFAPGQALAENGLGNVLGHRGRFAEAADHYRAAFKLKPDSPEPSFNLAQVLYRAGRFAEAEAACRDALRLKPDDPEAYNLRGNIRSALGEFTAAEQCYREALRLNAKYVEAYRNLGDLLGNVRRFEQSVDCYRQALLIEPNSPGTWNNLALALTSLGRPEEADACYSHALRLKPDFLGARLNRCVDRLPLIYRDEAEIDRVRADYAAELEAARRVDLARSPPGAVGATGGKPPFLLAYQGRSDRDLQAGYGDFVARVMASLFPAWTTPPEVAPPQPGEPVRVGILSAYFFNHSNWKIPIKGWMSALERSRFQLWAYHVGTWEDDETAVARALSHRFVQGPMTVERWAETIRADRLHVLLIPGIGMDPMTQRLAGLRLAPVQATSWGHPDTSGLPTIDDYLSSDLMEPPGAEAHYTERLVRLPNLSIWYETPTLTPEALSRSDLGLPDDVVIYWCCQSLYKYLPRFDGVFARIAAGVPNACFLFIEYPHGQRVNTIFRERLAAAFADAGLDAERHCRFLPSMPQARFAAVCRLADVFLDSLGWSGCNSTFEALAQDLPVVTMAGEFMRGRHSAAILAMLDLPDLVAADPGAFVDLAVALGRDPARRRALSAHIAANKHRLYRDRAAIDGLAAYLDAASRRERAFP